MLRYYSYCKKIGFIDDNIFFIYLIKSGVEVSNFLMLLEEWERLKKCGVLVNMSYCYDIKNIMKIYI